VRPAAAWYGRAGRGEIDSFNLPEDMTMDIYAVLGWGMIGVISLTALGLFATVLFVLVARWSERAFLQEMERCGGREG